MFWYIHIFFFMLDIGQLTPTAGAFEAAAVLRQRNG